ncbi:hypothetical protein NUH88_15205 [Nisaea acidiphila]|uniref:Uncharacterized protein n=1 Tax=Nisaea acidiphila TaxID=1862145 RepID=A0A9J7ATQ1_9PROT|nr:hypothetical protein [Nisaea acidiphila]UUX48749.1 hypothetical protein NUH88_15205 [Nisaea acidiphila]
MRKTAISILVHPATLIVSTLLVMAMAGVVGGGILPAFLESLKPDVVAGDLELTDDIAVILVTFGVFLEERELLAKRIFGEEMPEGEHMMNEHAEFYGAVLLLVGLVMEIVDQAFEPLLLNNGLATAGLSLMVLFHATTILVGLGYILTFFRRAPAH